MASDPKTNSLYVIILILFINTLFLGGIFFIMQQSNCPSSSKSFCPWSGKGSGKTACPYSKKGSGQGSGSPKGSAVQQQ